MRCGNLVVAMPHLNGTYNYNRKNDQLGFGGTELFE